MPRPQVRAPLRKLGAMAHQQGVCDVDVWVVGGLADQLGQPGNVGHGDMFGKRVRDEIRMGRGVVAQGGVQDGVDGVALRLVPGAAVGVRGPAVGAEGEQLRAGATIERASSPEGIPSVLRVPPPNLVVVRPAVGAVRPAGFNRRLRAPGGAGPGTCHEGLLTCGSVRAYAQPMVTHATDNAGRPSRTRMCGQTHSLARSGSLLSGSDA